ncbi:MAG: cell envelope integrity protein CreD [Chitinophagales bacterium]|jgi:inner membrane protein|nr:cell envelope integrity protein CreD [Chitinophagales bacterium]
MKNFFKNSPIFKLLIIFFLVLILLIPQGLVKDIIYDRMDYQTKTIEEVSGKWSNQQTITGPYLDIPYRVYVIEERDGKQIQTLQINHYFILPENLKINGELLTEKRYRNLYEVILYLSDLTISGDFILSDLSKSGIQLSQFDFATATINFGISDLRGIKNQIKLSWNQESVGFNSGLKSNGIVESGIHANIPLAINQKYNFSVSVKLKGSQNISFVPIGKQTQVKLSSKWQTPSFNGAFLPDTRQIDDKGFNSSWNIIHLNRNYPQEFSNEGSTDVSSSAFGVDLQVPLDYYQKSMRTIKYGILFLAFTFMTFFFMEILNKIRIHPINYLLVGFAIVMFFVLLLSISEHLGFNFAFILSALATIALIGLYVLSVLQNRKMAGMLTSMLFMLYAFIFILIQLESYALLIGSIGLFLVLAIVMYISRKIDWYQLSMDTLETEQPKSES